MKTEIYMEAFYRVGLLLNDKAYCYDAFGSDYLDISDADSSDTIMFYNIVDKEVGAHGVYELLLGGHVNAMEDFFVNPLEPTSEEMELWLLENGYVYPMAQYLKSCTHGC